LTPHFLSKCIEKLLYSIIFINFQVTYCTCIYLNVLKTIVITVPANIEIKFPCSLFKKQNVSSADCILIECQRGVSSSNDISGWSMRIVVTAFSRERGSGKHHRGRTNTRHATGNVSNFLWLLCIPMDRGRRSEMRASARCSRISAGVPKAFWRARMNDELSVYNVRRENFNF